MISCSKPNLGHLEGGAGMSAFCKPLGDGFFGDFVEKNMEKNCEEKDRQD